MPKRKKRKIKSLFKRGARVRVKPGIPHPKYPDIPLGGWVGVVRRVETGQPRRYVIAWTAQTLAAAHPVYHRRTEREFGDETEFIELLESSLELDRGEPLAMEQPTNLVPPPLLQELHADRIRAIFGVSSDAPVPVVDGETHERFAEHLRAHLPFPLEASCASCKEAREGELTVLGLRDPSPVDPSRGVMVRARAGQQELEFPLCLIWTDEDSPARQLLDDYGDWVWNDPSFSERLEAAGMEDTRYEEDSYYDDEEDRPDDADEDSFEYDEEDEDEDYWDEDDLEDLYEEHEEEEEGFEEEDYEEEVEEEAYEESDEPWDAEPSRAALTTTFADVPEPLGEEPPPPVRLTKIRVVGRNDPCPCGSGKKYKKCCMKTMAAETPAAATQTAAPELPSARPLARLAGAPATPEKGGFQIKITLLGIDPPIWRRVQTPDCTLDQLHLVIQRAMGWGNDHLYEFRVGDKTYSDRGTVGGSFRDVRNANSMTLGRIARRGLSPFRYEYDFGDSWEHEIEVEEALSADQPLDHAVCIAGQRACPPEDCGGVPGYYEILDALEDPDNECYQERLEWLGEFDPEHFDPQEVNL